MSLRIAPSSAPPSTFTHVDKTNTGAPSAPGLHDTLRAGIGPSPHSSASTSNEAVPSELALSSHPLEARLKSWERTQHDLRMQMLRRTYGIAEPVRREMELRAVREGTWRPAALRPAGSGRSVHEDILLGKDDTIGWEDIFTGEETAPVLGLHDEMERKLKI